jgi:hypothetical protein
VPLVVPRTSTVTCEKEQHRKEQIHYYDQKYGHDHCSGRGSPDLLGASAGSEPLETPNGRDRDSKHNALHQPRSDISQEQRVDRSPDVAHKSEICFGDAKK